MISAGQCTLIRCDNEYQNGLERGLFDIKFFKGQVQPLTFRSARLDNACPLANSLLAIRGHLCVDLTTAELLRSRLSLNQILKNIELISELDFNGRIQIKSSIFQYIFEQLRRPLFGQFRPDTSAPKKVRSERSKNVVQQAIDRGDLVHQKTEKDFDHLAFAARRQ